MPKKTEDPIPEWQRKLFREPTKEMVELDALRSCLRLLLELEPDGRRRVLRAVRGFFADLEVKEGAGK